MLKLTDPINLRTVLLCSVLSERPFEIVKTSSFHG